VIKATYSKAVLIFIGWMPAFFISSVLFSATPTQKNAETQSKNPTLLESTWLMPQVSVVMPSALTLRNANFSVDYTRQFPSLTQAGLMAVTPLFNWGGFRVLSTAKLGVSYKAGNFEMARSTGELLNSRLNLTWVPMSLGAKFLYTLPTFPFIKPSLTLGGGTHWFYQAGATSGSNGSFWIPYYFVTPALSFLEGSAPSDWFGGFTFGVTYQHELTSAQRVHGVSFDLGINILL